MWASRSWIKVWWVKFVDKTELKKRQDRYICSLMTFFRQDINYSLGTKQVLDWSSHSLESLITSYLHV